MANDFEKVIDEEMESLHKWQRNPPETAPKDMRVLAKSESGEFYCVHWVQNPYTGHEAWLICDIDDENQALLEKIVCWYELPGN